MYSTGYAEVVDESTQDGKDEVDIVDTSEYDNLPEFVVSVEGDSLDLSGTDKKSILSHPFHGGTNQQWIISVSEDGDGQVSIQSKFNGRFVGIQQRALDASLISRDTPYYWEVLKDGPGYKFVIPNSRLSLSLGASARLRFIEEDEGTRLYRFGNSEANRAMLKRGEIHPERRDNAPSKGEIVGSVKTLQEFLALKDVKAVLEMSRQPFAAVPKPKKKKETCSDKFIRYVPGEVPRNTAHPVKRLIHAGFASPWAFGKHTRGIADTTGDGFGDIVGFGETGMFVALNHGDNTFGPLRKVSHDFCHERGWRIEKHIRWMADLCNSGRADILAFGDVGVYASLSNGDGTYGPVKNVLTNFIYNHGWRKEKHPRFLADMDRTGSLDIIGFGEGHVWIARGNGDGTFGSPDAVFSDMTHSKGWRCDQHPRFLADMTGDGKLDLVGFGNEGVFVAFNIGRGRFLPLQLVSPQFGFNSGFRMEETHRFVADLTGNGCSDLLAIGKTGVFIALNNGEGFFPSTAKRVSTHFCTDAGWLSTKHNPRMLVDMTGDGRPDIVGIGSNAIYVLYNDGNGDFTRKEQLVDGIGSNVPEWANALILAANLTPA
ncbi:hypothetical protein D9619_008777 [Psilocybe cf. subviscida]|uniref:Ricin B lectin domain-containing protein n=1 Tax=Psilocybe cf. subviscida TaxID=2480587 RepID=A0A8H5BA30_9AGAR|nr:hypothetical protein D9619_008777 [Psilocybe cf. subviscida]